MELGHRLKYNVTREMNGKTVVSSMAYNNYGFVVNGKIQGTNLTFTEVFKRVTPKISGYYIFESQVIMISTHWQLTCSFRLASRGS